MDIKAFYEAYESFIGKKASAMVERQVHALSLNYSYQDIFRSIWYFYDYKGIDKKSIDTYGIGIIRDPRNMEEARIYFSELEKTRHRAAESAQASKEIKQEEIVIKRQKRRVYREEFNWDD